MFVVALFDFLHCFFFFFFFVVKKKKKKRGGEIFLCIGCNVAQRMCGNSIFLILLSVGNKIKNNKKKIFKCK